MKIIALVGMPGSGKSVLSDYLKNKGFHVIRFGGFVIEEIEKQGLPVNPRNEQIVREELRKKHGMDAFARIALPVIRKELNNNENEVVVIDGLYSFSEYKRLKKEFKDNLIVVAVFTPKQLRYERLASRQERPLTKAEAEERDFSEIERIEKGGPIAIADLTLINSGTVKQLIENAEVLLNL
jgi:dephospho-CoA kinase